MKTALIVAMAQNRVIGRNNQLPWYLPNDLKYFKRVTLGKPVVMGRNTWESIGRPLPGRANIVITSRSDYVAEGASVVHSLDEAMQLAESIGEIDGVEELMVIGGAQIYALALPRAERLYLTEVHAEVEGDCWFPPFEESDWQEVAREDFQAEDPNPFDYSFRVLERI